ncbi:MAG: GTPase [Desulfurococcaceae archaeon]
MKLKTSVKNYEELFAYINENLKKMRKRGEESFRDYMARKLDYVYQVVVNELKHLERILRTIEESGEFYRELFKAYIGVEPENIMLKTRVYTRIAHRIYRETQLKFREIGEKEGRKASVVFKENAGRILSLYKRLARTSPLINQYLRELAKMPDVKGDYVVVIAGLPQVGKSTLLSKLTRAKPEIGTYPYTTKTLIAGHMDVDGYGKIVLLDSPGILDTPLEDKNLVELKTVLAIKHLADHVLYIFAVYPHFYYTLEEQLRVYESITKILGDKPKTIVLNKVDLMEPHSVDAVVKRIEEHTGVPPIPISALTGFNLELLKKSVLEAFMAKIQRRKQ